MEFRLKFLSFAQPKAPAVIEVKGRGLLLISATLTLFACNHAVPTMPSRANSTMACGTEVPVFMVISGTTLDRERMAAYTKALTDSGLYLENGGTYLNDPRPLAIFQGTLAKDQVTLIVRFPSECAARRFWQSPIYQNQIKPMRENPSAGDYTVVLYNSLP